MQHLFTSMESEDFNTRKMAIDVVYTLASIHPIVLKSHKRELNDILNELRFDKIKPVREACIEALNAFKKIPELEVTEEEKQRELQKIEEKKQDKQKQNEIKKDIVKKAPRFIANGDQSNTVTVNGIPYPSNHTARDSRDHSLDQDRIL